MGRVEEKRMGALCFCIMGTLAIVFLCRVNWLLSVGLCLGSCLFLCFGEPFVAEEENTLQRILSYGILLWNILLMGKIARELAWIETTDSPLPGILLLLLCCYGVGKRDLLSVGAVIALVMLVTMGILFLFSLPAMEVHRLFPKTVGDLSVIPFGFYPTILLYLYKRKEKFASLPWLLGALLLVMAVGLVTAALGARDFYTASQSVNLLGTMERLEPFVAALATAGGFCTVGTLFLVNRKIRGHGEREKRFSSGSAEFLLAVGVCLLSPGIPTRWWAVGTTVSWGVIPVIQQGIVVYKKIQKNQKKSEKSA